MFRYYIQNMKKLHDRISRKIHEFINKIIFLEKKNIFKFEGLSLYPSEIHLILIISEKPTNATQMAEMLNVTKGAVSQTISRLEKKGILQKEKDPYYKNELTLTFTPLGKRVFDRYKQMRASMGSKLKEDISSFNNNEQKVIDKFLDHMLKIFNQIK